MIIQNVFQGRQFVFDLPMDASYQTKLLLKRKITENNGIVSYIITRRTNYLIRDVSDKSPSYRARIAEKYGIRMVTAEFVDACVKKGRLVKSKLYSAEESNQEHSQFATGKIVTKPNTKLHSPCARLLQVKTWPYKVKEGPSFHFSPYIVVKAVLLKGERKSKGHPFCVIEIHSSQGGISRDDTRPNFCVFTHQGTIPNSTEANVCGTKMCRFLETASDALHIFYQLYKLYTNPPYSLVRCIMFPICTDLGSDDFHIEDWSLASVLVQPKVAQFVTDIWTEAVFTLESTLAVPIKTIHEDQLISGERVLFEISNALLASDDDKVENLSNEFYSKVPHRHQKQIATWKLLAHEYNLCQLIRDMLVLQESVSLSDENKLEQQYFSLQCNIQVLDESSSEYKKVLSLILEGKADLSLNISNIFRVSRKSENDDFTHHIGNKKLLFHGSNVANFVGILSRGMNFTKDIYCENKNSECDGILGSGLYFSDELNAVVKYATPSKTIGRRLFSVSEVALGKCYTTFSANCALVHPPEGYDSVCGIKAIDAAEISEFENNEYVVYEAGQQRLKYVVEFYLPDDMPEVDTRPPRVGCSVLELSPSTMFCKAKNKFLEESNKSSFDIHQFLITHDHAATSTIAGLQSKANVPIPLKSVHIRAKLVDLAAEVVILQEYRNDSSVTIEARYVFPLSDKAAVCGFEAFSSGQHFIGRVEEKKEAQEEYTQAVESGKQAYLMDQEVPEVFKVSIGNVQPYSTVLVKIRYVAELDLEGDMIKFCLPNSVRPCQQQRALESRAQADVLTVDVTNTQNIDASLQIFVEMPFDIKTLLSPTHKINVKNTLSKAVITTDADVNLSNSFQLLIGLSEIHVPRMWVETNPETDSSACMLTFYPEFVCDGKDDVEIIIAVDASNSMSGTSFAVAQQVALLCLHYLPPEANFNILMFGTIYNEVFPISQKRSLENIHIAQQYILQSQPRLGSSRIDHFLKSYFALEPAKGVLRNFFIVSDGQLQRGERIFSNAVTSSYHTRLFTLGVGTYVNSHLLSRLSHSGGGSYEYFDRERKSKWATKIKDQMQKAETPVLTDVKVEWQQFNAEDTMLQAPQQLNAVFSGCRLTVYGFVSNCNLATLRGSVKGTEVTTTVFTPELAKSQGQILHCLTTKALLRDWELGLFDTNRILHEVQKNALKSKIIELSKKFCIITPLTSFVAVEDKDNKKIKGFNNSQPSIAEFLETEHVDFLEYIQLQTKSNAFTEILMMDQDPETPARVEDRSLQESSQHPVLKRLLTHDLANDDSSSSHENADSPSDCDYYMADEFEENNDDGAVNLLMSRVDRREIRKFKRLQTKKGFKKYKKLLKVDQLSASESRSRSRSESSENSAVDISENTHVDQQEPNATKCHREMLPAFPANADGSNQGLLSTSFCVKPNLSLKSASSLVPQACIVRRRSRAPTAPSHFRKSAPASGRRVVFPNSAPCSPPVYSPCSPAYSPCSPAYSPCSPSYSASCKPHTDDSPSAGTSVAAAVDDVKITTHNTLTEAVVNPKEGRQPFSNDLVFSSEITSERSGTVGFGSAMKLAPYPEMITEQGTTSCFSIPICISKNSDKRTPAPPAITASDSRIIGRDALLSEGSSLGKNTVFFQTLPSTTAFSGFGATQSHPNLQPTSIVASTTSSSMFGYSPNHDVPPGLSSPNYYVPLGLNYGHHVHNRASRNISSGLFGAANAKTFGSNTFGGSTGIKSFGLDLTTSSSSVFQTLPSTTAFSGYGATQSYTNLQPMSIVASTSNSSMFGSSPNHSVTVDLNSGQHIHSQASVNISSDLFGAANKKSFGSNTFGGGIELFGINQTTNSSSCGASQPVLSSSLKYVGFGGSGETAFQSTPTMSSLLNYSICDTGFSPMKEKLPVLPLVPVSNIPLPGSVSGNNGASKNHSCSSPVSASDSSQFYRFTPGIPNSSLCAQNSNVCKESFFSNSGHNPVAVDSGQTKLYNLSSFNTPVETSRFETSASPSVTKELTETSSASVHEFSLQIGQTYSKEPWKQSGPRQLQQQQQLQHQQQQQLQQRQQQEQQLQQQHQPIQQQQQQQQQQQFRQQQLQQGIQSAQQYQSTNQLQQQQQQKHTQRVQQVYQRLQELRQEQQKQQLALLQTQGYIQDSDKICSMSFGAGLPFCSTLLKQLTNLNSEFFFTNSKEMTKIIIERLSKLPDSSDCKYLYVLDSCNCKGAIKRNELPINWNHELWCKIQDKLASSGLKSMGSIVHDAILDLIATIAVLFAICDAFIFGSFSPNLFSPEIMTEQAHSIAFSLQKSVSEKGRLRFLLSLLFITSVNQRHPLVYRSLELGNSWEEAFYNLTNEGSLFQCQPR